MNIHRLLRILAIITSIGSYMMLVMGTLVTNTGSGEGCGNTWPFCHGQIIPGVITIAGMIEYSRGLQASLVGMLVLVLTVGVWLVYKKDLRAKLLAFLSLLFVVVQGVLGALTVVFEGTLVRKTGFFLFILDSLSWLWPLYSCLLSVFSRLREKLRGC